MLYERMLTYPRLLKLSIALMHITCLWLSYRVFTQGVDTVAEIGALTVSGFWLGLTAVRLGTLLRSYFDHLSRLQVTIPVICGTLLAVLALWQNNQPHLIAVGVLEILGWLAVYFKYRQNRANYIEQNHGPLPKQAWVNPDATALQPGDLILTNGRMASTFAHDSLGHAEVVFQNHNGDLYSLSSYMESGTQINELGKVTKKLQNGRDHYVVMRPLKPLSAKQNLLAPHLAMYMLEINREWTTRTNQRRQRIINFLPVPQRLKNWLIAKTRATGYDWAGLFIGTKAKDHWTCIAISVQFLQNLGVPIGTYGTGLLGLGTGILDPIQPVRFLGDKAFRLLDVNDKARFEGGK